MRALLAIILLAACGGDDAQPDPVDVHELMSCDSAWMRNGYTDCEWACVDSAVALHAQGTACEATTVVGGVNCSKTFVFGGVTGCCISHEPQVIFGVCN